MIVVIIIAIVVMLAYTLLAAAVLAQEIGVVLSAVAVGAVLTALKL